MANFLSKNRKLISLGIPKSRDFWVGLLVTVLQGLSAVALMATSAWLISRAAQEPPIMYLNIAVVLVRGFALGRAFFRYLERLLLHNAAFAMLTNLRPALFAKLIPLAPAGLGNANRADTVTRLVNDVDEIQNLPLRVLAPLLQSTIVTLATVGFLTWLNPGAGLVLLVATVLAGFVAMPLTARKVAAANFASAQARARLNIAATTLVENLEVLDAYEWTTDAISGIEIAQNNVMEINRNQAVTAGLGSALFSILATLATAGSAYFGALSVASGQSTPVMLAVFALVPLAVFDVLQNAQPALTSWQRYVASASRINEILTAPIPLQLAPQSSTASYLDQTQTAKDSTVLSGVESIELVNLAASYPNTTEVAVANVNIKLQRGQTLLVTGPSGAGKSTIGLVIAGLLNPESGHYLINGKDYFEFDATSRTQRIGYLEQNPVIFMGTLRANLLIAKPEASDQELWQMLERVKLAQTFRLRDGLETELGERGVAISGGEAQRIALARALLANFEVLVFDEPTANVDPTTANNLWQDFLANVTDHGDKMAIFISHEKLETFAFDKFLNL